MNRVFSTSLLKRRVQEGIFDEPFSLGQIYVFR